VTAKFERLEMSEAELAQDLAQAKAALPAAVFERIDSVVRAYSTLVKVVEDKDTTIGRLRRMLFGATTEKSLQVLPPKSPPRDEKAGAGKTPRRSPPGHGRNGQDAYSGAPTETVPHHRLKCGDRCPGCRKGKVYDQAERPGILVRVTGQPPLCAKIFHLQKLRCNLCGDIFEARPPAGVGRRKYDETAASMIGLLKYGGGFPWNRLHKLQDCVGIPLPSSTQWDIVRDAARSLLPAYEELERLAAQGRVLHNDDTTMKILARMGRRREEQARERGNGAAQGRGGDDVKPDRKGIFTSGIVSQAGQRQIALFCTGARHAGENLKALLEHREQALAPPIQMCDALSRNVPKDFKTILANCLAHGRRQFVDQVENFPRECECVLRVLAKVYKNDAIAKKRNLTDAERLRFHQAESGPGMEKLHAWLQKQIAEKLVEPNSGMGGAIEYMLKHWEELTLFLRKAGAPLDNNICERALKMAILHRKNSLFYKTDNGARVGDVYMSIIHTCDLNGADPFDYLTQLQRHAKQVRAHPEQWLPWTYRQTIDRAPPA
jgi:hypothetical protein